MPSCQGVTVSDIPAKTAEQQKDQSGSEGPRDTENQGRPALVKGKGRGEEMRPRRGKMKERGEPF